MKTRAITGVRPLLAERGCAISPDARLRTLAEVVDHLGATGKTGIFDGIEIRVRRPAIGRKDRDTFISGKDRQNGMEAMVFTDEDGRLFCSPTQPGSCAYITHAPVLGLVKLLSDGPAVEILADGGYQGLGAQTGGRVVTPPQVQEECPGVVRGDARASAQGPLPRRIRVEHGIAHMKNWRAPARRLGRREHMDDTVQAVVGRPAVPAADRRPDPGLATVGTEIPPALRYLTAIPCTRS
ncbi:MULTISPECIES: transposase family protein [unclassified Streptomyces]|uniref:transposase family protein n=1 Tax=unclassified Streptomyces TaxID=2593676 RepID=UPI00093A2CD5|nr:transposase family protein [Streptomyces sp. TSRI0281]